MIKLKNWSVFASNNNGFIPPEFLCYHLQGKAYGHPRFNDGDPITTSRIVEINDKGDYKEAKTKGGSVYCLYPEDVDPEAENQFPNYYERLCMKHD